MAQSSLYFQRVHWGNWLLAWVLSFRYRVLVWHMMLPSRLGSRFEFAPPYKTLSRDEWLLQMDKCFDVWNTKVFPELSGRIAITARYGAQDFDFSGNVIQHIGKELEDAWLFCATAGHLQEIEGTRIQVVLPWVCCVLPKGLFEQKFSGLHFCSLDINRWLELFYEWGVSLGYTLRFLVRGFSGVFRQRIAVGRREILWLGISSGEIPDSPNRLNFAWACAYGFLEPERVAYFLPNEPSKTQRRFIQGMGVTAVSPVEAMQLIPRTRLLRAMLAALAAYFQVMAEPGSWPLILRARFMAKAPYWDEVAAKLEPASYLTSTSASWPESPEVAVMKARGITTVIWAYSANTLAYTNEAPEFRDLGMERSALISDEFWVWHDGIREWLARRSVMPEEKRTQAVVQGALMCGNPGWMLRPREEVARHLGLPVDSFVVNVFDLPLVSEAWRRRYGGGPWMIGEDAYGGFFDGIESLMARFPEVVVLIKLRRNMDDPMRMFPARLLKEADGSGGGGRQRLFIVDANIDTFIPLAASNLVIGMTYTSPPLVALSYGKPAIYFDPLARANHMPSKQFSSLTVQTREKLEAIVAELLPGRTFHPGATDRICPPPIRRDIFRDLLATRGKGGGKAGMDASGPMAI